MHLAPLIRDLAVILAVAGLISLLFQRIRQPVVLGYIIAGIVIGPYTPPFQLVTDLPSIRTWAELGVVFLMFTLGLEFSFRKLARVGGSATIAASAEVLFFLPVGYLAGRALGWKPMDSLFLGAMLSISSTTIIIKALDELKLKKHRFAELIFAILIVEDLFAILLLVALGTIAVSQTVSALALLTAAFKLVLVVGGWFLAGYLVVPRFMRYVGRVGSDETLTILSLGFCLALVVFANHFHYSTALGAFIMGSIIAESPVLARVEHSVASLRDLFGAIFFVSIGMLIDPRVLWEHRGAVAALCALTILGKIVSTGLGALASGQSLRNSVRVGFGLAQIGEFSFIIAQLGLSLNVTSDFIYPVAVAVSLVTTFTTPYLIRISGDAATAIESILPAGVRRALERHATRAEARRAGATHGRSLAKPTLRWSINALATTVIFVLSAEWGLPMVHERAGWSATVLPWVGWSTAMLLSSPFVWAMLTAFRTSPGPSVAPPFLRVLAKLVTLLWIGTLSAEFFPGRSVLLITVAALGVTFAIFYRNLESAYRWFEDRFLAAFDQVELGPTSPFSHLAPWDAHLVTIEVHPNSPFVMKRISEAAFRARHGVNIVAIQRGRKAIVPPSPEEVLLPLDQLVLLGTDEQIERLRSELEPAPEPEETRGPGDGYELRRGRLATNCPFAGQTIRETGFREKYQAIVVGIERAGERHINPDSDLRLAAGDLLWIAGEKGRLNDLMPHLGAPALPPPQLQAGNSDK